jgi:hypothetical protein
MTNCQQYNLTENIIACYKQHPANWIVDNWLTVVIIIVVILLGIYILHGDD